MIRAVLAVALATAMFGVALPGIDQGRVQRTDRLLRGEVAAVERAAGSLLAADETTPGAGARRTVTMSLPGETWSSAGVEYLRVRGGTGPGDLGRGTVVYRLSGGRERTLPVDAPLYTPDGPVRPGNGGRLVLSLVYVEGRRAIRVSRSPEG